MKGKNILCVYAACISYVLNRLELCPQMEKKAPKIVSWLVALSDMLTKKNTRPFVWCHSIRFAGKSFGSAKLELHVFGTNHRPFTRRSFVCDYISPLCLRGHFVPAWPDWGKENVSEHKSRRIAWQQTSPNFYLFIYFFLIFSPNMYFW